MNRQNWEEKEAKLYKPGTPVELKNSAGKVYYVQEYDPMMVPPVWLEDYPKPCYPEELKILSNLFCLIPRKMLKVA